MSDVIKSSQCENLPGWKRTATVHSQGWYKPAQNCSSQNVQTQICPKCQSAAVP